MQCWISARIEHFSTYSYRLSFPYRSRPWSWEEGSSRRSKLIPPFRHHGRRRPETVWDCWFHYFCLSWFAASAQQTKYAVLLFVQDIRGINKNSLTLLILNLDWSFSSFIPFAPSQKDMVVSRCDTGTLAKKNSSISVIQRRMNFFAYHWM